MHDIRMADAQASGALSMIFGQRIFDEPASASDEVLEHMALTMASLPSEERAEQIHLLLLRHREALQDNITDPLTGLLNREGFMQKLKTKIDGIRIREHGNQRRKTAEKDAATVFIDLDGFKAVNDTCGHEAGDDALREVAKCLQRAFRTGDVIARIGGDELALVIEPYEPDEPDEHFNESVIKDRIRDAMDGLVYWRGSQAYPICASIGVVIFNAENVESYGDQPAEEIAQTLLSNADTRMYEDKQGGKIVRLDQARCKAERMWDLAA